MRLTIFLDEEEAKFLNLMIPASSPASESIGRAFHTREYWGSESRDVIVDCDDSEAMELLAYAQSYCASAGAKIRQGFRLAHLRLDDTTRQAQRYR
jgi:hypothetical protein